ncbi:aspartyl-phosphate phosphatase Spo0E family protein [Thalassobacillus hwangdonensis]|uniref:Aspartyl-phosphate phosphatase Spo0E family protein n=1 Tax=Thalassobacillus hwangdonensis TaxID=546108 RepID=A0ABW3L3H5_9BACI
MNHSSDKKMNVERLRKRMYELSKTKADYQEILKASEELDHALNELHNSTKPKKP